MKNVSQEENNIKLKSIKHIVVITSMMILGITTVQAAITPLIKYTSNTYVTSEHGDSYFADTYKGVVSVRGADKFFNGRYTCYPTFAQITYDVQGTKYPKTIRSKDKHDKITRKDSIIVSDKWNIGSKTKVYGNIGEGFFSNVQPMALDDVQ